MMHDGWIILDKPSGMFSRRAAGIVARMFGARTFGHIGTLDEMASGVLPVALGNATKMIPFVEEIRPTIKEYTFSLKFGFETDTLDAYGRTLVRSDVIPSRDSCKRRPRTVPCILTAAVHTTWRDGAGLWNCRRDACILKRWNYWIRMAMNGLFAHVACAAHTFAQSHVILQKSVILLPLSP